MTEYNLNRPWETLDDWQKEYIETPPEQDCFLLNGRQTGKTTAMSIKSVELCINHFKAGENILIASLTEKQGFIMLAKALAYATAKYNKEILKGKDRPTMHRISLKNGTNIFCYAAGETGEGLRGFTIKKLMVDEGSRMSREFFIAVLPMLSVIGGSMDVASTPCGKEGYFYECSKDEHYKKFYVSAEDCPRHTKEFLESQKKMMSKLEYAQEYLAQFLDELRRVFSDELIEKCCILKRKERIIEDRTYFLGVDVAGWGKDETTLEILDGTDRENIKQVENEILLKKLTTETSQRIIQLERIWNFKEIGVDDGGVGFGVFSELLREDATKRKTKALNNASRPIDNEGEKSKKLLKEEMYLNLLLLLENLKIRLLDDDEIKASLASIQHNEEDKIFGNDSHICEGIVRAAWLIKTTSLNIYIEF